MILILATFAVAMAVTWFITPSVMRLAIKRGAVAVPRDRDVHDVPTPRWGGIAIYAGVVLAAVLAITARHIQTRGEFGWSWPIVGVFVAGTFIALVGMVDDLKDLKPITQVICITVAGCILFAFGVRVEGLTNPAVFEHSLKYTSANWLALSPVASLLLTLFWVFLVTKTVDAVDGLDGLAAGVCAIAAATLALLAHASKQPILALIAASVVGACVGFLKHNFAPARIFMSTVGAQFLGLTLASLSIMGAFKVAAAVSVLVPVLVLGVPIFDYGIVLIRRFTQGAPLTGADKRHFHHRLLERGFSKRQAVLMIYACTAVFCVIAVCIFRASR